MSSLPFTPSLRSAAILRNVNSILSRPAVTKFKQDLFRLFFDSYRPELHYMRGPGPRWREKYAATALGEAAVARKSRKLSQQAC